MLGDDSIPSPVLARSSFLAKISARMNAARFGSDQYEECAYITVSECLSEKNLETDSYHVHIVAEVAFGR